MDAVVHTLACAALEIYEKHCRKAGRGRMFDFVQAGNPGHAETKLWSLLNAARNFFKHEGESLDELIELDDTPPSVRWNFQIDPRASGRGG
jgi:hypothetical protein